MPSLKLSVPHQLGQEAAETRIKTFLEKVRNKYESQVSDLQQSWTDNVLNFAFKTYGFAVKGSMAVEPNEVRFEGVIPFAALMFKGKIEQTLREEMTRLLS
jgi:putative polyhydroxyalkanoic acid system protein